MTKINRKISLLIIALAITTFFINTSIHGLANPIPIVLDSGSYTPVPYNVTAIHFKSETVIAILSDTANVTATYTFKNTANQSVNQTILLPFWQRPYNLSLTCNSLELNYSWSIYNTSEAEDIFNISSPYLLFFWTNISAINFMLSFEPYEEKTIFVNYTREYERTGSESEFRYIARTGALWPHPIENAVFEFKINRTYYKEPLKWDYDVTNTTEYVIGNANFSNWTPTMDLIIHWGEYQSSWPPVVNITWVNITALSSTYVSYLRNKISNVTYDNNTVVWKTSTPSTSIVIYRFINSTQWYALQNLTLTANHTITLGNLEEGVYQFYVISTDGYNNTVLDNNNGTYYTFIVTKENELDRKQKLDATFIATLAAVFLVIAFLVIVSKRKSEK